MDAVATWTLYGWIGWGATVLVQLMAWFAAAAIGKKTWRRLRRAYHLTVIVYWLRRLEREGLRTFDRPD